MIILVGRSASGKTYIGKCLEARGYKKIVTYTTRDKRPGEIEDIDYHFISGEDFISKIRDNFFFEYVTYNGNYYGTAQQNIRDKMCYLIVEPNGLAKYKALEGVVSFFIDCDKSILQERMIARKDKIEVINERLAKDDIIFNEDVKNSCDFIIDSNKDINLTLDEIEAKYNG